MLQAVRVGLGAAGMTGQNFKISGSLAIPNDGDTLALFKELQSALNRFSRQGTNDTGAAFDTPLSVDGRLGPATLAAAQSVVKKTGLNASAQTSSVQMLAGAAREVAVAVNIKADSAGRPYTSKWQPPITTTTDTVSSFADKAATAAQTAFSPFVNPFREKTTTTNTIIGKRPGGGSTTSGGNTTIPTSGDGSIRLPAEIIEADADASSGSKSWFSRNWLWLAIGGAAAVGVGVVAYSMKDKKGRSKKGAYAAA